MVNYRTFQFSHDLFWGFKRQIDLDEVNSLQECIDMMYIKLFELLKRENFVTLIEKLEANREQLHIHNMEFGDILISDIDIIIYICDHGKDAAHNHQV
jgi:hypothetical protein